MNKCTINNDDYALQAVVALAKELGFKSYRRVLSGEEELVSPVDWIRFKPIKEESSELIPGTHDALNKLSVRGE